MREIQKHNERKNNVNASTKEDFDNHKSVIIN